MKLQKKKNKKHNKKKMMNIKKKKNKKKQLRKTIYIYMYTGCCSEQDISCLQVLFEATFGTVLSNPSDTIK